MSHKFRPVITMTEDGFSIAISFKDILEYIDRRNYWEKRAGEDSGEEPPFDTLRVYDRQAFLAYLVRRLASYGLPEGSNLPDEIEEILDSIIEDACFVGAGIRKHDKDHPEPIDQAPGHPELGIGPVEPKKNTMSATATIQWNSKNFRHAAAELAASLQKLLENDANNVDGSGTISSFNVTITVEKRRPVAARGNS